MEETKPLAIFICGPTAAGKSSTIRYLKEQGLKQGSVMDYDQFFKDEMDKILTANAKMKTPLDVSDAKVLQSLRDIADKRAWEKRELQFTDCVKNKRDFTFESTMPDHAIQKMKEAKEAGFKVITHVTFQTALENHILSERRRRKMGVEVGATFKDDKEAAEICKKTYQQCLKGIQKSMAYGDVKVYINYMNPGPPEQNRPVLVAEKSYQTKYKLQVRNEVNNPDLKATIGNILVNQSYQQGREKGKDKEI